MKYPLFLASLNLAKRSFIVNIPKISAFELLLFMDLLQSDSAERNKQEPPLNMNMRFYFC